MLGAKPRGSSLCFGLGKNLSESSQICSTVSHSPPWTVAVIMPPNIYERSNTAPQPQEEHFSDVIGNSYILHTAQAYILFSQFLYFWPNRTESFESTKKDTVSALSNSWKDWDLFPVFLLLITGTHWKSWDRLAI